MLVTVYRRNVKLTFIISGALAFNGARPYVLLVAAGCSVPVVPVQLAT